MRLLTAREAHQIGIDPIVDHLGELAHVGADGQVGQIDAAQLVGIGMNVHERLPGVVGRDQRVSVGGRFAEPRADGDDEVGFSNALLKLRVRPIAELAGVDLACVADCVLAAEGRGNRDAVAIGEVREMVGCARAPVGPADDRDRRRSFLQELK